MIIGLQMVHRHRFLNSVSPAGFQQLSTPAYKRPIHSGCVGRAVTLGPGTRRKYLYMSTGVDDHVVSGLRCNRCA